MCEKHIVFARSRHSCEVALHSQYCHMVSAGCYVHPAQPTIMRKRNGSEKKTSFEACSAFTSVPVLDYGFMELQMSVRDISCLTAGPRLLSKP